MKMGLWLFRHMRNPQRKASGQLQELTRSLIMDQNQRRSRNRRQKRRNQKNNQKLKKKNPRKREEKKIHRPRPKKASKTTFNLASMYFWTRSFCSDNSLSVDASPSGTHGPGTPKLNFTIIILFSLFRPYTGSWVFYSRLGIVISMSGEESISSQSSIFSLGITSARGS